MSGTLCPRVAVYITAACSAATEISVQATCDCWLEWLHRLDYEAFSSLLIPLLTRTQTQTQREREREK